MVARRALLYAAAAVGAFAVAGAVAASRPDRVPAKFEELNRLAVHVDHYIPGFSKFARAAAYGESRGNSEAINENDAGAACRAWQRLKDSRFAENPWRNASDWCFGSGGWFGFLPTTALSAQGFRTQDPHLIFDPEASIAMFADYIRRIVKGHWDSIPQQHHNWLTIRRFMAGNTVGLDWREEKVLKTDTDGVPRSVKTRLKFGRHLTEVGIDPSFMYEPVRISGWPGAAALWQQLESTR